MEIKNVEYHPNRRFRKSKRLVPNQLDRICHEDYEVNLSEQIVSENEMKALALGLNLNDGTREFDILNLMNVIRETSRKCFENITKFETIPYRKEQSCSMYLHTESEHHQTTKRALIQNECA
ncbi:hypothetical protein GJ496_002537 [Pomphorhynchus laevis]|nr:hypothetical protein GJ496_002537 [Pomphorhynchus laevis]